MTFFQCNAFLPKPENKIMASLTGAEEHTYDKFRGNGTFQGIILRIFQSG